MPNFSFSNIVTSVIKLFTEAADLIPNLPAMLDNFVNLTAPEVAVLAKFFPSIATMDATAIADLKSLVGILTKFGPTMLPFVLKFLSFLNTIFSPPAPAGTTMAAAHPGSTLPGAQYPL